MRISELRLQNFRNYTQARIDFDAPLTILTGENAQGKTNIAEAIFLLTLGRSFRTNNVGSLINRGASEAIISGKVEYTAKSQRLGVRLSRIAAQKRRFYLNSEQVGAKDFFGQFLAVVFRPRDVSELFLNPTWRRNLLDYILCLTWPGYFQDLLTFRRVLRSRNALISRLGERGGRTDQLLFWDEELVRLSNAISKGRFDLVSHYRNILSFYYERLSCSMAKLDITYHTQIEYGHDMTNAWRGILAANWVQERRLGFTISGPHRDDISFKLHGHSLRETGSSGEWRSVLLALKLAEADYLYKQRGERAVILLDDVLSELDINRRQALLDQFSAYQTFLTATETPSFIANDDRIEIKKVHKGNLAPDFIMLHD